MEHIENLRPNLPAFLISSQAPQFSNFIFKINKLNLLWGSNFIALGVYLIFKIKFSWNKEGRGGVILVLMSNWCYLAVIWIFRGYLVVTARYLVITRGYCSLLVVTARCRSLLLVPTFNMNMPLLLSPSPAYICRVQW